jgi:hypothetical protein
VSTHERVFEFLMIMDHAMVSFNIRVYKNALKFIRFRSSWRLTQNVFKAIILMTNK